MASTTASATAAGDGGRQQGGATSTDDGNDSNRSRLKRKQADIPEQDSLSWGTAGNWSRGRAGREALSAMKFGWTRTIQKQQV